MARFGLRSASIYSNDLGNNKDLENYTGHIEHEPQMLEQLQENGIPYLKRMALLKIITLQSTSFGMAELLV